MFFRHNHKNHSHLDTWPWDSNVWMPISWIIIDLKSAYMNDGRELLNENYPDCSFYLHSTCVSITKNIFEDAESSCLPGCTEYSIHQESIHVSFSFITPISFQALIKPETSHLCFSIPNWMRKTSSILKRDETQIRKCHQGSNWLNWPYEWLKILAWIMTRKLIIL